MEYFLSMRGAAAFLLLGLFSLWLARTLKIRRPGMPSWVALVLAFILLFEPSQLAFIPEGRCSFIRPLYCHVDILFVAVLPETKPSDAALSSIRTFSSYRLCGSHLP